MIALLSGLVMQATLTSAVVSVGGLGLQVFATPDTLARLRPGEPAELHTFLVVREDALTLYGFADADARDTFVTLQTVSGVGPRLALAVLSVLDPEALRQAVAGEDTAALSRVPGIGKKTAQRLLLELAGKLAAPTRPAAQGGVGIAASVGQPSDEVVAALISLGWQAKVAADTVTRVGSAMPDADIPTLLRACLRSLGGGVRG